MTEMGGIYKNRNQFKVVFGRGHTRYFRSREAASRHLNFIRTQYDHDCFDPRDWQKARPLALDTLAEQWLDLKKKQVKYGSFKNLNACMTRASEKWVGMNIKLIRDTDIHDFIWERDDITSKTRANMRSCLHDFFTWGCKRAGCPVPEIEPVEFELGWREIVDLETQAAVLARLKKISHGHNPRIWIAAKWVATYVSIRPDEIIGMKERHINTGLGCFIIPSPKEKRPKIIPIIDEDLELIKSMPRDLPDLYFFRHPAGIKGVKAGSKFGPRYLYKWVRRAMEAENLKGYVPYAVLRHSTITALGEHYSEEELASHGTFHASSAIRRYMQKRRDRSVEIYERAAAMRNNYTNITPTDNRMPTEAKLLKFNG